MNFSDQVFVIPIFSTIKITCLPGLFQNLDQGERKSFFFLNMALSEFGGKMFVRTDEPIKEIDLKKSSWYKLRTIA